MARPVIDISVGGDDEPTEIKKNKFWHRMFVGQKKLAIVLGTVVTIGGLGNMCYMGYGWAKDKVKSEIDLRSRKNQDQQNKHSRRIDSICTVLDTFKIELKRDELSIKKLSRKR